VSRDLQAFLARARGAAARLEAPATTALWELAALRGRLVELSARGASATMTTAIELVLEAQQAHEPVAWIVPWSTETTCGTFYPPDAAAAGIDLAALVVVRAPSVIAAARAVERVLRSGAFGLAVLDLGASAEARLPDHVQGRLVSLAQAHDAAIVCLTDKPADAGSLGSMVSLRAEALRARTQDGFEITVRALKDKRRGPGWARARKVRGPAGL
jgi:recombination protein RecA